jgi:hypothetical protein
MFDNLKQKTNESIDKSVDDTREAARVVYDDAKIATHTTTKNAEVKARKEADPVKPVKIGDPQIISDLKITANRVEPELKKAEI